MLRFFQNVEIWIVGKCFKFFGPDLEIKKSTVLDGFFLYLAQTITSMRGCVAYNDLWPWPISSRSFGLRLENRVRSVASTVLDGFFPYLVQMITIMRRCVAFDDIWPWPISSRSFDLDFENQVRSVTFSVLDRLFFWLGIQYDSIVLVIMRRQGVSSERRRSSYSSYGHLSISYLYILSSNFRRCVTYNVSCEMLKFEFFSNFFKTFNFDFVSFRLGIWCESLIWIIMGWQGVSQTTGVLVVLVIVITCGPLCYHQLPQTNFWGSLLRNTWHFGDMTIGLSSYSLQESYWIFKGPEPWLLKMLTKYTLLDVAISCNFTPRDSWFTPIRYYLINSW